MNDIDWRLIKVLVVDDDDSLRRTLAKFFDKIGCVGAYAANGIEALNLTRTYNFDVCLMDLFMPQMGGVEAAQIIHDEINPQLPIIALTSSSMAADQEKCEDVGMQDYLIKPVSLDVLKDVLRKYGTKIDAMESSL